MATAKTVKPEEVMEVEMRLSQHEAVCAERYEKIALQFDATNARLKRLESILIGSAGAIIMLLLSLVTKM